MLLHFIAFWPFDLKPKFSNRTFIETTPQINEYYFHLYKDVQPTLDNAFQKGLKANGLPRIMHEYQQPGLSSHCHRQSIRH